VNANEQDINMATRLFRIGLMLPYDFRTSKTFRVEGLRSLPAIEYFEPDEVYYAPMLRAIANVYADELVELHIINVMPDGYLAAYQREKLDGMLVLMVSLDRLPLLRPLLEAKAYYVAIGVSGSTALDHEMPCIDCANREGGHAAADHLLALGHREFGCVNLADHFVNHSDRMQGFIERVAAAGCSISEDRMLRASGYEYPRFSRHAAEWTERLIDGSRVPTGVFACDFNMAEATLLALQGHGISVPNDVSLVGFDDPPKAAGLNPPLTTMRQPVHEMGARAARRLLTAIRSSDPRAALGMTEILPTELIVRQSTEGLKEGGRFV
jgi:DNA-binding LacI/PurR family transcriptional regulator